MSDEYADETRPGERTYIPRDVLMEVYARHRPREGVVVCPGCRQEVPCRVYRALVPILRERGIERPVAAGPC